MSAESLRVYPDGALLVRAIEVMGNLRQEAVDRGMVFGPHSRGDFQANLAEPQRFLEDVRAYYQLVFLFPAAPVTQTPGLLALVLDFPTNAPPSLHLRHVHLRL